MIKLDLQMFAKTASQMAAYRASIKMAKGQMPGKKLEQSPSEVENKTKKGESREDIEKRITNSHGYVKEIVYGQKYTMYNSNKNGEKLEQFDNHMPAADVKEWLEGYSYNENTGTFTNGEGRHYLIKLEKKKKK